MGCANSKRSNRKVSPKALQSTSNLHSRAEEALPGLHGDFHLDRPENIERSDEEKRELELLRRRLTMLLNPRAGSPQHRVLNTGDYPTL